ncbi:MAG: SusC/RagA family TonB-linked outer membrane protein [Prolixibacteraceae bacterium]
MNKIYQILILITCILFVVPGQSFAQRRNKKEDVRKIVVSSILTDESGHALGGINILDSRGSVVAMTDQTGAFSVEVPLNSILQIEEKGFKDVEIPVGNVPSTIVLTSVPFLMDESDKIPILFAEIKKKETVGASYTLNISEFWEYDNVQGLSSNLNGRIPGLLGTSNIRGIGSPLFLVDGLPTDISNINTEEIDRITVLKDANSSILYGTQATNGVVQVTTKRGVANRQKLNVIAETGIATPVALPEYLGSAEYMKYRNQAALNDGMSTPFSQETIDLYASGQNPYRYPDVDFYSDEFIKSYRNQSKAMFEVSGGNKVTRYYTNAGWIHQGTLYNIGGATGYGTDKFNVRSNIDVDVTDFIKTYISLSAVFDVDKAPVGNFWSDAATIHPYHYSQLLPLSLMSKDLTISDGSDLSKVFLVGDAYVLGGSTLYTDNIYGDQAFGNYSTTIGRTIQYMQGLQLDLNRFIKGLTANAAVRLDMYNRFIQGVSDTYAVYEPTWLDNPSGSDSITALTKVGSDLRKGTQAVSGQYFRRAINAYISVDYQRKLSNRHFVSGTLLGYTSRETYQGLLIPEKAAHLGLRLSYNYAGKYLVDFSSAYVNGYKFAPEHRGGFSPSLGLAWVISDENFLLGADHIDFLKLRASAGIMNYEPAINDYTLYDQTFSTNGSYSWDDGVRKLDVWKLNRATNDHLGFQKAKNINLGLEGYFFNQSFCLDVNAFYTVKSDLIIQKSTYPGYMADYIPYENYEETSYKGVEAGLIYKLGNKRWGLDIEANVLYATSERVKVDEARPEPYMNRQGKSADAMFGLEALGFFKDAADIANSPEQAFSAVQPGDIKYKDQNGDNMINENDQVWVGNSQARWFFGMSLLARYENFSLFALGTGRQGGYDYYNGDYFWIQGEDKYSAEVLTSWTEETKETATYPRLSYGNNTNNFQNSTFWLYKNDFFRLERVQLNYVMPKKIAHTLFSEDISFFLRGENLLRVSRNVEKQQLVIGGEPNYRSFSLGLKVKF